MLKLKTYITLALAAAVLCGCERQDIGEYENDPRIYFFLGVAWEGKHTTDSMTYSFFFAPEDYMRDTVYVDLRAMGLLTDYARPFTISQIDPDVHNAAVPGKHYVSFDSEEIKKHWQMPANEVRYLAPIILLRDQSLSGQKVELKLKVTENTYFRPGIDKQTTFRIIFTSKAEKPLNWDNWMAFGTWGERKMWFVINYLGITDFDAYPTSDYTYPSYLRSIAQKQLAAYNANNPTLTEADGTVVTFD